MRDDVSAGVSKLCLLFDKKKTLLNRLILSESDKLHYVQSENPERVSAIILEDDAIIDEINLIDCDIAETEESLARIIGITPKGLYRILRGNVGPARELITRRREIRTLLEHLLSGREKLSAALGSAAGEVREHIEGIARIRRLKLPEEE
ncbi:MAG: hypothetical protein JW838_09420 [Spirochaetes bacterium]|nr:hypothetical protein [Spirochaetota bacterium]